MRVSSISCWAVAIGIALAGVPSFASDGSPTPHSGWSFAGAREIPVQAGGRVKPFDSFAREVVLFLTGSRSFQGWSAVDMLLSQIASPEIWDGYPFIQVSRKDVRRQLGLDEERSRFTPKELRTNPVLAQYAMSSSAQGGQVSAPISNTPKADPREQEFRRVFERLGLFRRVVSGEAWTLIPASLEAVVQSADAPWRAMSDATQHDEAVRLPFVEMIKAYQASSEGDFESAARKVKAAVEARIPGWSDSARAKIAVETRYNGMRPFLAAWIVSLMAALIWVVARATASAKPGSGAARGLTYAALGVTATGAAFMIAGIAMRSFVAGRPPVTNMYESVIWVSLGQMVFAAILYAIHRQSVIMLVSTVLATVGLIAADSAQAVMDPGLHPLVPVLRSNYWLTIHVLTITLGYAAFALTLGLANVSLWYFFRGAQAQGPTESVSVHTRIASMNQLTYRAMQFGVVLLAAGTILGGVWADYSWGRFWGWDPKEVWALIALLCYLVILHGRFAGWVGQLGFAVWSVISFLSVIMAWYGVNFVLGAGLHSYGFSSGGFGPMMAFVGMQLAWVGAVYVVYKRRLGHKSEGAGSQGAQAARI